MIDLFSQFAHLAPVVIFIASLLDILFVSGLFLYGAAMMTSIGMLHATGMISVEMIILSSYTGTLLGNIINFGTGKIFGKTEYVSNKLTHPKVETAREFLRSRGLFIFMTASRFFAISRPVYALLLGSLNISFKRFFVFEALLALAWVIFWLFIILQGENLYFMFFDKQEV